MKRTEGTSVILCCLLAALGFDCSRASAATPKAVDTKEMLGWIRTLSGFGAHNAVFPGIRQSGTRSGHLATAWIEKQFKAFGLQRVRRESVPIIAWEPTAYNLEVTTSAGRRSFECWPLWYTRFIDRDQIEAEMIYVGLGSEKELAGKDLKGKIVVADMISPRIPSLRYAHLKSIAYETYDPDSTIAEAGGHRYWHFANRHLYFLAAKQGAAGFVAINVDKDITGRFFPNAANVGADPANGKLGPLVGLCVNSVQGAKLREFAATGARAAFRSAGEANMSQTYNVVGALPGTSKRIIQLTSHSDGGAVNDGTGVAAVLALAKRYAERGREGHSLKHTLQFVITGGHFIDSAGVKAFMERHKDALKNVVVSLTVEHVGRHFDLVDGRLVDSNTVCFHAFFSTNEDWLGLISKAVHRHDLRRSLLFPASLPVADRSGEGWSVSKAMPSVWRISPVQYMQSTLDTREKVAVEHLPKVVAVFQDLIGALDSRLD